MSDGLPPRWADAIDKFWPDDKDAADFGPLQKLLRDEPDVPRDVRNFLIAVLPLANIARTPKNDPLYCDIGKLLRKNRVSLFVRKAVKTGMRVKAAFRAAEKEFPDFGAETIRQAYYASEKFFATTKIGRVTKSKRARRQRV